VSVLRKVLLAGSTNPWLRERATKAAFVKRSVRKFMPGERVEDALAAAVELKTQGITTILTALGENLTKAEEAEAVTQHYLDVFDKVAAAGLDAHISVKPTQLGLDLDRAMCERNLDRLLERADQRNNFLWIDMEYSRYVDATLALFRRSRAKSRRIGIALQAYLYRTGKDVESLSPLGPAVRIVKGAYLEPPDVAFPKKSDVDENFYKLCLRLMAPDAQQAARCCTLPRTTRRSPTASRRTRASTMCPRLRTSSRCCTGLASRSSGGWRRKGSGCASLSAMASTGSRGTCAGLPSGRRMCGSS
jgi:proline dehydrogenase